MRKSELMLHCSHEFFFSKKCFHIKMLFIFLSSDSIGKVQENTEFYWRYQRYSFVREYFEHLPMSYPPLIIFSHILLLFLAIKRKFCPKLCLNQVTNEHHVPLSKRLTPIFSNFQDIVELYSSSFLILIY